MCFNSQGQKVIQSLQSDFTKIKFKIEESIPIMGDILTHKDWEKIHKRYICHYANLIRDNQKITALAFVDIIMLHFNNDNSANAVVKYVQDCVSRVSIYVKSHSKFEKAFHNILRNMIMSFDEDANSMNSDFKNWISELSVLSCLCCPKIELLEIETPLGNGKSADFSCKIISSHEQYTFDVVTYQNIDPSLHQTSTSMNEFLNKRISDKYLSKTQDIPQDAHPEFRILPVVEFRPGMEVFTYNVDTNKSLRIMTYFSNTIDGKTEYCFTELNNLCERLRKMKNITSV